MSKIFVRPALARPGLTRPSVDGQPGEPITHRVVRNPVSRIAIPPEGALVELDTFVRRRLREGDLIQAEPSAAKPTSKPAAKSASEKGE